LIAPRGAGMRLTTRMNPADELNHAIEHHHAGRLREAEAIYRQILATDPSFADARHLLGVLARQTGRNVEAIELISRADRENPDRPEWIYNLGNAYLEAGQFEQAIAAYERAIQLKPDFAEAHSNLGSAFTSIGQLDRALAEYRQTAQLSPQSARAHYKLGNALRSIGEVSASIRCYEQAIALNPGYDEAHYNLSLAYLTSGDYKRGWANYERRWKICPPENRPPHFSQPRWRGEPLSGRKILIFPEQGYGDVIFFLRYLPLVVSRGGEIIFGCDTALSKLLTGVLGITQLANMSDPHPAFDVQCSAMGLPYAMQLGGPEDVPWNGPYLKSDPEVQQKFHDLLAQGAGKLKVGLVWAGRVIPAGRSLALKQFGPLANPRIQFYSLQVFQGSAEAKNPPPGMNLIDVGPRINDFADLAALIEAMDLIITVDTAAAHLAGAMAKPVWTLLKRAADWRWGLDRNDSPWYPTMKLFRQQKDGDWTTVIDSGAAALQQLV
jgi:tetratricopeptide (TPR) repeat protein